MLPVELPADGFVDLLGERDAEIVNFYCGVLFEL